jgi:DNA-binding beta-propeller fold protein YncE
MTSTRASRPSAPQALLLTAAIAIAALALPGLARGADSVYWSNYLGGRISQANLDGGGTDLDTGSQTPQNPTGVAIDAAANRIYWADRGANAIFFANLDGGGGGSLYTGAATVSDPYGLAIDPAANRIYWASSEDDAISYANLDGTGGADLDTSGVILEDPRGIAIDPAANRIYWASFLDGTVAYANLDGTGGAAYLDTTGAVVERPSGLAIDKAANRIYWTNGETPQGVFYASLDGGGGGQLDTAGVEVSGPGGIAIDPGANRLFWANGGSPDAIMRANLDGSGGSGELDTAGANLESPVFLALLRAPQPAPTLRAPAISGQKLIERPLYCDQGAWMADLLGSYLYRAPRSYSYGWLRNGETIRGETESRYRPTKPGTYNCLVTATNAAGSTTQKSTDLTLERGLAYATGLAPVHGRRALVTLSCVGDGRCKGLVKLIAHVGYRRVVHREGRREVIRRRALFPIGKASFSIFPGRTKVLHVKLKRKGKRLLERRTGRRMRVRLLGRDVQHRSLLLKAGG